MKATEHFVRESFGWVCRRCYDRASLIETEKNERTSQTEGRARFFSEGEAEEREPHLSTHGLARWREEGGARVLFCPACEVKEEFIASE